MPSMIKKISPVLGKIVENYIRLLYQNQLPGPLDSANLCVCVCVCVCVLISVCVCVCVCVCVSHQPRPRHRQVLVPLYPAGLSPSGGWTSPDGSCSL